MPRQKQFDRQEVLEKATDLFWKQGFHATSMQDLVEHLGINRASLYGTFGSKNELYEEALSTYRAQGNTYLRSVLLHGDSARSAIKKLFLDAVKTSCQDAQQKGCFVVNCTTEYLPKNKEILSKLLDNKSNFEQLMGETLQRGKDNGEFSKNLDVEATAAYLYTFFSGLKVIAKVQTDEKELERVVEIGLSNF